MFDAQTEGLIGYWLLLAIVFVIRFGLANWAGKYAQKKGYRYWPFALAGAFVSIICTWFLAYCLPKLPEREKTEQAVYSSNATQE